MNARGRNSFHRVATPLLLFVAVLVCATSQPAMAQLPDVSDQYTIQVIEPPAGTTEIWWTWVNEAGLVVMQYFTPEAGGQGHAGILENGIWTNIDVPGSVWCGGSSPSASGRVGLTYAGEDGIVHAAIYHRGTYQYLPDHPVYQFGIGSISDRGLMAAQAFLPDEPDVLHGLLLNTSLSLFHIFDPPGSTWTAPFGINNAGLVVGQYGDGQSFYGFLYDGESFTDIKVPGAEVTCAASINSRGDIVGSYADMDGEGNWRGFLLLDGEVKGFTIPESTLNGVDSITDRGQLSGSYADDDGLHGFIATPKHGGK
jgi:hypothetical protein